jgi:DNA-binding NtrC family response regulator
VANILVVDDESALLESMRTYLIRLGHSVTAFQNAESAWELFTADLPAFSVVIVDMTLEGMPGEKFIRKVLDRNPAVAVLATSGYPGSLHNFETSPGARIAMLEKPFTPRMLTEARARLLGEEPSAEA